MATSKAKEKAIAKSAGKKNISAVRNEPGKSNAGKYSKVKKSDFAGPSETFPINTKSRARNALARAHFAKDPEAIKAKVVKKYPELKRKGDKSK